MKSRFPEPLGSEFQRDHAQKSLFTVRAGLILGALLYGAFGFVDTWALPETRAAAFRIRFFFAIPGCSPPSSGRSPPRSRNACRRTSP